MRKVIFGFSAFAIPLSISSIALAETGQDRPPSIQDQTANNPPPQDSRGWIMAEETDNNPLRPQFRFVVKCLNGRIGDGPRMENRAEALDRAFAACAD
jgi:hypothetical protein